MNIYLEIATPLASKSATLFLGTGFSRFLTNNNAPNWQDLIIELTKRIDSNNELFSKLFSTNQTNGTVTPTMDLYICAQILELEYKRQKKSFRNMVSTVLQEKVSKDRLIPSNISLVKQFFNNYPGNTIVTTNYDNILQEHIFDRKAKILIDGQALPKTNFEQSILHLHGSIIRPSSIVITLNDYFKFQHQQSYVSRKFFTLLQETTVLILGYSLGDFNLNSIINEAQQVKSSVYKPLDIYFATANPIDDLVKDYYGYCYGIKVVDNTPIDIFLRNLSLQKPEATKLLAEAESIENVLSGTHIYTDDFIRLPDSFNQILIQALVLGKDLSSEPLLRMFMTLLEKKKEFTNEKNAWSQYDHLANWLIDFAIHVSIPNCAIEQQYCQVALHSFLNMSKELKLGYSWAAFKTWKSRFREMRSENRNMIADLVKTNYHPTHDSHLIL